MKKSTTMYKRHRFPPEIIQHAVWSYYRFNLSHRDIEDLLAVRGIVVSYESVRLWCNKFGPKYARRLKRRHHGFGDTFFIDEVFVKIDGIQHYLWRAVAQDGEVVDVFLPFTIYSILAVTLFQPRTIDFFDSGHLRLGIALLRDGRYLLKSA